MGNNESRYILEKEGNRNPKIKPMEDDQTEEPPKEAVPLDRAESPTTSYLSMKSEQSMDYPSNFATVPQNQESLRPGVMACDICSDLNSVKFCLTCSVFYCKIHIREHYIVKALQRHILMEPRSEEQCQRQTSVEVVPAPRNLKAYKLKNTTIIIVRWKKALEIEQTPHQFLISHYCPGTELQEAYTDDCIKLFFNMQPGNHKISVSTMLNNGMQSEPVSTTICIMLPPPGKIQFLSVKSDCVSLSWDPPEGLKGPHTFKVTWGCDGEQRFQRVIDEPEVEIYGLKPGEVYEFSVATQGDHGNQSSCVSASVVPVVPAPRNLKAKKLKNTTIIIVHWEKALEIEQTPHQFLISHYCPGTELQEAYTEDCIKLFFNLQPGNHKISVSTMLNNGMQSEPVSTTICIKPPRRICWHTRDPPCPPDFGSIEDKKQTQDAREICPRDLIDTNISIVYRQKPQCCILSY